MRIALIGRSGQVATEVQRQVGSKDGLIVLARPEMDLADPDACAAKIHTVDADVILNAAAYTAVDKAEDEEPLAHAINAEAPAAMAHAAAARGIPFLQVSTDYVYDGSGTTPWTPDSPAGPLGAYGRTKLAGDLGVIAAAGPHAILRTSWVFSAHGNNFVKTMLRLGREREELNIVADQIGGPTPAADIAAALLRMGDTFLSYRPSGYLRTDGSSLSGAYHFSGTPDASWADFAREIFRQSGITCEVKDIPTSAYPTPAQRPANSRLDCTNLTETFGIARPDWRKSLAAVLARLP